MFRFFFLQTQREGEGRLRSRFLTQGRRQVRDTFVYIEKIVNRNISIRRHYTPWNLAFNVTGRDLKEWARCGQGLTIRKNSAKTPRKRASGRSSSWHLPPRTSFTMNRSGREGGDAVEEGICQTASLWGRWPADSMGTPHMRPRL